LIVLHAIWNINESGKLHLWAETANLAKSDARRSTKLTETQKPRLHPFTLMRDDLVETLGGLLGGLPIQDAETDTLTMRLPSTAKEPFPSPELVLAQPMDSKQAEFRWWYMVTAALHAGNALDFLLALPDRPPMGMAFGSDLRFWIEAARFCLELLTRQCFVPVLDEVTQGRTMTCRAGWEVFLSPEDGERMQRLARQMPPLCWSFVRPEERNVSLLQTMMRHFLNQSVDAFVRESLSAQSLLPSKRNGRQTPQEQWVQALASADATFTAPVATIKQFSSELHNWLNHLQLVDAGAAFRTCFRLDPPGDEDEQNVDWRVSFHLQANDDRSLLVPAENVWTERSSTLTFLKRKFENPQERLLADLGKASRLFPAIEKSLKSAHPQQLELNTEQAYTFLRESAPLLEQSGFGVLVPPWWQKPSARVGVKLRVKPKVGTVSANSLMGLDSIVDYQWQIAIGDATLSTKEFEKLVNLKQPLIKVRGQWVELRPEQIEAAIAFFKKKQAKKDMSLGDAFRIGLGEGTAEMGLPVLDIEADGWIKDALERLSQNVPLSDIEVPATFQGKLRPYQLKGVSWLAFLKDFGFGACLADSMGLGKTIQLITLLLHERDKLKKPETFPGPTLLICPMSIVGNWQKELQRFGPSLNVMIHYGPERLSDQAFADEAQKHDIVITTYALALRDKEHLKAIEWENVVIDEAQNIKNETAKQTQAIKQLQARHKIAMTGTPVENRLSELWSIMEFLNPGYLGTGKDFHSNFAIPIERYHNVEKSGTLKRLIQPFVLRRLKTDKTIIQDLPDKMEMNVFCNLTQEQASLYEAVVKEMMEKIELADGLERKGLILAALTKLKQVCNHPAHFLSDKSSLPRRSGKLARLEEMVEEVLEGGEKALIFTQYAEMGHLLQQYLQERFGCEILFLHGGTPKKQRDIMVQRFQEERRGAPIFILSLKAGGVGLNLTAANHVFHFDRWWNPAVENQATDRAFRIGQTKNVQVHKFVCIGTLEERIDQMIEQKKVLAESIVGSGEGWLTEMSTDQLKSLFQLNREAVGE
jgi:SNF2 family DNA or RNA helicase